MTAEHETNTPVEVSEQDERNTLLAAKVAESFRRILGPNFGSRIALGIADQPSEEESKPYKRIQEDTDR